MFKKNLFSGSSLFDTLIGSGATLAGDLNADGKVRIDGKVKGDVKINGDLAIGETALIIGNVSARSVDSAGTIEGNVNCKDQLKLASTAKLTGDIQVNGLTMEEGSQFHGICSMSSLDKVSNNVNKLILASNYNDTSRLKRKPIISRPQVNDSNNL